MERIKFTYESDDGDEVEAWLPAKYEVCDRCHGKGSHVNPNIDGNGITASEMEEICYYDPDFPENYMSGMYDVQCENCKGLRVVLEVDEDNLSEDGKKLLEIYNEQQFSKREDNYERAYFARMEG